MHRSGFEKQHETSASLLNDVPTSQAARGCTGTRLQKHTYVSMHSDTPYTLRSSSFSKPDSQAWEHLCQAMEKPVGRDKGSPPGWRGRWDQEEHLSRKEGAQGVQSHDALFLAAKGGSLRQAPWELERNGDPEDVLPRD